MPRLENRPPAEGINASHENPLRELAWLLVGSVALLVALAAAAAYGAQWLAPKIPYRYEARLAAGIDLAAPAKTDAARAVQRELQALAERLAARMDLPPDMQVRVGYRDEATVNAAATLGGQLVFFRGLLERLDSEDALAMVMAHELAHLKYRHPAAALGRGLAVGLLLSTVSAEVGRSAAGGVLGQAGLLTLLSFNREQEREADAEALHVIAAEYGHVGGAFDLFSAFTALPGAARDPALPVVEFLRTHPLTALRIQAAQDWARDRGIALGAQRRPLPPAIASLRAAARNAQRPDGA